jgi:hypothetical protein
MEFYMNKGLKLTVVAAAVALTLTGCSSMNTKTGAVEAGPISAINTQKLTTNFTRQGIKMEFDCAWGSGLFGTTQAACIKGDISAIEVTAYATSNGNTENNRETAFTVAEMRAKAKLRHFIYEDISSNIVQNTVAKNIEKANDRTKMRIATKEDLTMTDEEAKDSNWALRENTNDTVRTVTESVQKQAGGILKGVFVSESKVVDRQTVQVTVRWDRDSEQASLYFNKKFR